jgi:YidC/Oxa1 family membrane protein insertase
VNRQTRWIIGFWTMVVLFLSGCEAVLPTAVHTIDRTKWWNALFIGPLSDVIDFLAKALWNEYGLAILGLTIIIRLCILPLTIKQYQSSKQMQKIRPELLEIQKKHKGDTKKMNEALMNLYAKHGVSPVSGCLPMLIQMPILISLYYAILGNPSIWNHDFLWLALGKADPYYVLPILAACTTFLQQETMKSQMPQNMRNIMLIFPVLIFMMSINFPSALVLYWVYSNTISIIQNIFLYKNDVARSNDTNDQKKKRLTR